MSSDSGSESDEQLKQFLEATDTTLLNNSMFEKKKENIDRKSTELTKNGTEGLKGDSLKSQRYILEHNENFGIDFNLPESMQNHLAKKLKDILKKHYEFCDVFTPVSPVRKTKYKNPLKLLKGDQCVVSSYEDFKYDCKGPEKKPVIKRRIVDNPSSSNRDKDAFKLVAIDGNFILSGQEVATWAKKKDRKDKVYHYRMANNGIFHEKEEINEFTEIRLKNKWNEKKIKNFKNS